MAMFEEGVKKLSSGDESHEAPTSGWTRIEVVLCDGVKSLLEITSIAFGIPTNNSLGRSV